MDATFYERFGRVYYPGYNHMWGDTELSHVSDLLDTTINLPILFAHEHYTTGKNFMDAINHKNNSYFQVDEDTYISRVKEKFGLSNYKGTLKCPPEHIAYFSKKGINICNI
jgi:hypothetical protein